VESKKSAAEAGDAESAQCESVAERERAADERERVADARERDLDARERAQERRERERAERGRVVAESKREHAAALHDPYDAIARAAALREQVLEEQMRATRRRSR
jgi:hypothetical protein